MPDSEYTGFAVTRGVSGVGWCLRHACGTARSDAARFRHGSEGIGSGRCLNGSRVPILERTLLLRTWPRIGPPSLA